MVIGLLGQGGGNYPDGWGEDLPDGGGPASGGGPNPRVRIRRAIERAHEEYRRAIAEVDDHQRTYRDLIREGASAPPRRRAAIAVRARRCKFEAALLELERLYALKRITAYTVAEAKLDASETLGKLGADEAVVDEVDALDAEAIEEAISELEAGVERDLAALEALDVDGAADSSIDLAELDLMRGYERGEITEGDLELEATPECDPATASSERSPTDRSRE